MRDVYCLELDFAPAGVALMVPLRILQLHAMCISHWLSGSVEDSVAEQMMPEFLNKAFSVMSQIINCMPE